MDSTICWAEQANVGDRIAGDRRFDRRYRIQLDLRWKLIRRRRVLETGTGRTVDISSSGILFQTGRPLPAGLNVELSVSWPALLHDVAPLQLVVFGKVVRAYDSVAAIRMSQHEFKTVGIPAEHRRALSATVRPPPAVMKKTIGLVRLGNPH